MRSQERRPCLTSDRDLGACAELPLRRHLPAALQGLLPRLGDGQGGGRGGVPDAGRGQRRHHRLPRDSEGRHRHISISISYVEPMLQTLDLCNAKTFNEQVQWSFRIFDCDNSKSIGIDEFGDSVRQVWQIFDGLGDEHNPGDCEKVGGGQNETKYVFLCFCVSLLVHMFMALQ